MSLRRRINPYRSDGWTEGKIPYGSYCAHCHGIGGTGQGNIPTLKNASVKSATDGEVFWFITTGAVNNGMPSWSNLPEKERWQIVNYVKKLAGPGSARPSGSSTEPATPPASSNPPPPRMPFTDYRFERSGEVRKITVNDLPAPFATASSGNGPEVVPRPNGQLPQAPPGFEVSLYASGLENPREIRAAPNGDVFVSEMSAGKIALFRGIDEKGNPKVRSIFASGLDRPFGIAFYPPGPNPLWIYVANNTSLVRFPYQNGDLKARGPSQHLTDLPKDGHATRDVLFAQDGKKMFVSIGSATNVDNPDTSPAEKNRADILELDPDGSNMRVYAYGIRNPVTMAFNPETGELWTSVNERDGLGDDLVPDYITHVQDGGFSGWPWWYIGGHQDPRRAGEHPELKETAIIPDVLLQPHNASLEIAFYEGTQFPTEYKGDLFAAEHGSWNRSVRAGYEVIRVPFHQTGHATGEYQDFLTGFVVDNGHVWGRPVGVTVAQDGSLLVTDDGSNSIWRVAYTGK
jgi:glucose/arabinose dehydrogenase